MTARVLAGDLGATKTVLMLADVTDTTVTFVFRQRYENHQYPDFVSLLAAFRRAAGTAWPVTPPACLGVAGPVIGHRRARMTNLPWELDAQELAAAGELDRAFLLNDLEAFAHGLAAVEPKAFRALQPGSPDPVGPQALMAAGTGLGQCIIVREQGGIRVLPSEAGHADFAPADARQLALLEHYWAETAPVSVEHFLSGPGLARLYAFTSHPAQGAADDDGPGDALSPESITQRALEKSDPAAQEAVDLFLRIYGAQAGNTALSCLPTGGLFIGGGIAVYLAELLADGRFISAFRHKSRMEGLLADMPVHLVLRADAPVLGAALVASDPSRALPLGRVKAL